MAETDECGDRACFWMADVIVMHSDITSETGSTATETGRERYCIREETIGPPPLVVVTVVLFRGRGVPGAEGAVMLLLMLTVSMLGGAGRASLPMLLV